MNPRCTHAALLERWAGGAVPLQRARSSEHVRALVRASPRADASVGFSLAAPYTAALNEIRTRGPQAWGPDDGDGAAPYRPASAPAAPLARAHARAHAHAHARARAHAHAHAHAGGAGAATEAETETETAAAWGAFDRCQAGAEAEAGPGGGVAAAAGAPERVRWRCAGCQCDDPAKLVENSDSSLVCADCGVVAHATSLVALSRQKNCRAEDDKTDTADDPSAGRGRLGPIHGDGVETAEEARKRRQRQQLSTRIGAPKRNRADGRTLCAAQERVLRTAASPTASPGPGPSPSPSPNPGLACTPARRPLHDHAPHALEAKGRKVATAVAMLWKHNAPGRDPRLERGVQILIMPTLEMAQEHAQRCPVPACRCRFRLLDRSNNLLALLMSQLYLKHTSVQEHPGLTEQHLQQQVDALAPISVAGIGKSQVAETFAALSNVMGYTNITCPWETYCLQTPYEAPHPDHWERPCAPPLPSPLQLPVPALAHNASTDSLDGTFLPTSPHSLSSSASPALSLSTPPPPPPLLGPTPTAVRQAIGHAVRWSGCSTSVHADALTALSGAALRAHLEGANADTPPPDVLALLILRAVQQAQSGVESAAAFDPYLQKVCRQLAIADQTAEASGALIAQLITAQWTERRVRPPSRLSSSSCCSTPPGTPASGDHEPECGWEHAPQERPPADGREEGMDDATLRDELANGMALF